MTDIDTTTLRVHAHLVALGDVRPESVADVAAVMTDAATEVDRLRAVVLKHGDHTPACRWRRAEGDGRHCIPSCGWDAIGGEFAALITGES